MKAFFKAFFFSQGKPFPPYVWISLLMALVIATVVMRLLNVKWIDNTLVGILAGFVTAWVGLFWTIYSYFYSQRKKTDNEDKKSTGDKSDV